MKMINMKLGSVCLAFSALLTSSINADSKSLSHEYASPGKPAAPIQIDYEPLSKPLAVGDTVTINVKFQIEKRSRNLSAKIKPRHADKVILGKVGQQAVTMKNATESQPMPIQFTAVQDGVNYIDVIATIDSDAGLQFKSIAIPIIVGQPNWDEYLKPQGELQTTASGQKVIALPAEERIR